VFCIDCVGSGIVTGPGEYRGVCDQCNGSGVEKIKSKVSPIKKDGINMFVVDREVGQTVLLDSEIYVTILNINSNGTARLCFDAPDYISAEKIESPERHVRIKRNKTVRSNRI